MREWYKNSSQQMNDPEMEHLQSVDSASCAVWEWAKGMCKQRDDCCVPVMKKVEEGIVARRLGITSKRLRVIVKEMEELGWIDTKGEVFMRLKGWKGWQAKYETRTSGADAKRKRDEYWKKKTEESGLVLDIPLHINEEEFIRKFREWVTYRRELGCPVADEKTFYNRQVKWLGNFSKRNAIYILETTMRNGWRGLEAAAKMLDS